MVYPGHDVDVAIVGAGPGGLSCAAAYIAAFGSTARIQVSLLLCSAHFRPTRVPPLLVIKQVYESYERFRPQGSGVLMNPNVQYALEAISPDLFEQ